ncbi:renin receptor, partial [Asbolus verrucosus]
SGSGELTIFHHPSSLVFKGHDPLKESILKEVYSTALGFSTEQYSNWNGVFIEDPFNLAEAIVTIAIDGVANIDNGKGHHFPLRTDEDESEIFTTLEKRVLERYPESNSQLVRINLGDGLQELHKYEIFQKIKHEKPKMSTYHQLKNNVDEDREFLKEIITLNNIADLVEQFVVKSDNVPDIYWFKIASLHPLTDLYGENSTQMKEAQQILNDVTARINNAFNKVYNGRVLVSVITSDAIHTRRTRNILAADGSADAKIYNLAKSYSKDYPVIFNIILWFGVAMVFSILAICIAIATMDPGRDSIIYRMTSTRLKKDN